jgi:hypothetical protein
MNARPHLYLLEAIIFPVLIPLVRTCLIALTFAGLPQSNPATPRPVTPDGQATPAAGQETEHGVEGNLATILQSGSTNTRGYKVVIHNDGSATAEISGAPAIRKSEPARSQQFPPGTINTKTLRRLLAEIGDVGKIPTGGCAKSASFGTRTEITYAGKTSGDLQCVRQQASGGDEAPLQASKELSKFVQTTLIQLKVNDKRISSTR